MDGEDEPEMELVVRLSREEYDAIFPERAAKRDAELAALQAEPEYKVIRNDDGSTTVRVKE